MAVRPRREEAFGDATPAPRFAAVGTTTVDTPTMIGYDGGMPANIFRIVEDLDEDGAERFVAWASSRREAEAIVAHESTERPGYYSIEVRR